jgi:hypothetical protein
MENTKEKYIADLKVIRQMMDRSCRFISLSGLSGVIAGMIAIITAYLGYELIYEGQDYFSYRSTNPSLKDLILLVSLGSFAVVSAVAVGYILTVRKAKQNGQSVWGPESKQFLGSFFPSLITGGLLVLVLLLKGFIGLLAPLCLLFYGLALVNASKFTLKETRSLGFLEIVLGLLGIYFIGYGLVFWVIGFGFAHIGYGIFMHLKYGS